jgi:hypothetical protein
MLYCFGCSLFRLGQDEGNCKILRRKLDFVYIRYLRKCMQNLSTRLFLTGAVYNLTGYGSALGFLVLIFATKFSTMLMKQVFCICNSRTHRDLTFTYCCLFYGVFNNHGYTDSNYNVIIEKYSKTSLIRTNWERILVQISESPNYRTATENKFKEVIKSAWRVLLGNKNSVALVR